MKISLKQSRTHDLGAFAAHFYVEKKGGRDFNALLVDCVTRHYKTRMKGAARAYLVLEGNGTFVINGEREAAEAYDFFIISDGDVYEYEGEMKLFEFNVPATDASNEEKLE